MGHEFKSNVGSRVSKKEAKAWIERYDKEMRKDKKKDTKSIFYGRDALLKMLSEEGSAGITFFFALKYNEVHKKEIVQLVMVPTKEDGKLIWPNDSAASKAVGGAAAFDDGFPCPPYCPK